MSDFNSRPLLNYLRSFWRDYYSDTPKLVRFWEAATKIMDDEWAQAEQVNDSTNVSSCPTFIRHTYFHKMLDEWNSYWLPHTHFRKDFRSSASQSIFYIGDWPDPKTVQVFLDGKEVDPLVDPFIVTLDQDVTQPSTNPAGARLVFENPLAAGKPVHVFADRLLSRTLTEITSAGLLSIPFGSEVDVDSVRIILKKINITRFLEIEADKFYWESNDPALDTRVFRRGEVFEVDDGTVKQSVFVSAETKEVPLSTPVNPLTAVVYKILDFEITEGSIEMSGPVLTASGSFPVSARVRARDVIGAKGVTVETPTSQLDFGRSFDSPEVFMYDGKILGGCSVSSSGIIFERSFMEGVVILVEAALAETNDHAHERIEVASATDEVSVPPTRPFALTATLLEDPHFPIQLFIDGILIHPDLYGFKPGSATTTIKLNFPLIIPAGSVVDIFYVDKEDPVPHKHVRQSFRVDVPTSAFHLSDFVQERFNEFVSVNGIAISNPDIWKLTPDGYFLNFSTALPTGTLIRVRGARTSFGYWHEVDPELVRAEYLQDGIDEQSVSIPNGWTVRLAWGDGFTVEDGILETNVKIEDAWFVDADFDERTGFTNFGSLIGFDRETSDEYMKVLKAIFPGNYMGSQPEVIENFVCIILGSDYLVEPSRVDSINGTRLRANGAEYYLDPEVPVRARAGETYERFYALSYFARIVENWEPFDAIAVMAEKFSEDYRYGKNLDIHRPKVYDGGNAEYDRNLKKLIDPNVDFYEWEVWPGDLIRIYPQFSPTTAKYTRVKTVEQHALGIDIDLGQDEIGYGEEDYGEYTYGGASVLEQIDRYTVWSRETDKIDTWRFLDEALTEEIPYLSERFTNLLSGHVFLVKISWNALRDGQAIDDVNTFLDRTKPEDTQYIGFSEVYEEDGLEDEIDATLADEDPEWDEIGAEFFFSELLGGYVGEDGQIDPNVGSFFGIRFVP